MVCPELTRARLSAQLTCYRAACHRLQGTEEELAALKANVETILGLQQADRAGRVAAERSAAAALGKLEMLKADSLIVASTLLRTEGELAVERLVRGELEHTKKLLGAAREEAERSYGRATAALREKDDLSDR